MKGSIVALVTPFKQNRIDTQALQDLVQWHEQSGTDGIVVVGSTGEASLLSRQERLLAIQTVVNARKNISIIAGVGTSSTEETIQMAKDAQECHADAIMVVTPCYVKPSQDGIIRHFQEIAKHCSLPIIIYNNPGRTGTNLTQETLFKICQSLPQVIGIKDSSNNLGMITCLKNILPQHVALLSGDDGTNIGFLAQGGQGSISVTANVFPKESKALIEAWNQGNLQEAMNIHSRLMPVHKVMFCQPSPSPVKYALSLMEKIQNEVRLPLLPISDSSEDALKIKQIMETVQNP